jgi:hypothetical protein
LTINLSSIDAEKITKYDNWVLGIKKIWKINNVYVYPLVISEEAVVTKKNFLKYLENVSLTKNILGAEQKAVLIQTCHIVRKFLAYAP